MSIKRSSKVDKYIEVITEAKDYFTELSEKRQETYDGRSGFWQESEKGEEWSNDLSTLDDLVMDLDRVVSNLEILFEEI